ncbi:MAG TPA: TMEM175 family protein [Chitinophagaceae bacterium]|nr:TMEM175 family protein [Chitinophagaceae bacterium]
MSAHPSEKEIIHREFELERVILFSDAVFAIAITLLIIDIKFPELPENLEHVDYLQLFKPLIFHFLALCISFFFIGTFWSRHLRMFKYLRQYNQGVIVRNLFFMFFIVTFPFSAEGIAGHVRPGFVLPLFIYIGNVALCSAMHLSLGYYIFYKKPQLSVQGHDNDKKYIFLRSKYFTIIIFFVLFIAIIINIFFPQNYQLSFYSFYLLPIGVFIMRRKLKKYKPREEI